MISEEKTCESHALAFRRTCVSSATAALSVLGFALASTALTAQDAGTDEPATPAAETAPATPAQQAAAEARSAMSESKWEAAVDAWKRVLADSPDDAEAKAGLASAQAALDQGSTIEDVEDDLNLRRQRAVIEFNADLTRADNQLDAGDYDGAQRTALTAKVRLDRSRGVLPPAAYSEMSRRVETMLERISDAKINAQLPQFRAAAAKNGIGRSP